MAQRVPVQPSGARQRCHVRRSGLVLSSFLVIEYLTNDLSFRAIEASSYEAVTGRDAHDRRVHDVHVHVAAPRRQLPVDRTPQVTTEGSGVASFSDAYLRETIEIIDQSTRRCSSRWSTGLAEVRDSGGRLFVLGVGGSAGSASHAVNDFRKICGFEAYTPTDNVSELTARTNDDGWESVVRRSGCGARASMPTTR